MSLGSDERDSWRDFESAVVINKSSVIVRLLFSKDAVWLSRTYDTQNWEIISDLSLANSGCKTHLFLS
jgi:hypothetical protein